MTNKPDPLTVHKARVAAAERELLAARDAMRSRAKILGISHTALFGDCAFVSRESAKSWVKDARAEVRTEMNEESLATIKITFKAGFDEARRQAGIQTPAERAEDARWARVSEAIQSIARNAPLYETDPEKCDPSYLQMRRQIDMAEKLSKLCKAQGLKFSDVFGPGSLASPSGFAMAEKLLGGAKTRARATVYEPDDVAQAIVESGRRRRGESTATSPLLRVVADNGEPVAMTSEGILLAGKRRRGEI
jgi:hypothetical protein